ncbi:MAG: GDYXXLXY domain-containing protein [Saprospiraceae bacterium]
MNYKKDSLHILKSKNKMDFKKITIIGFILTCLAQLFIPAKMIMDQENVLKTGTEFKFRTRPVDPNDPFRGKYITLDFMDNTFLVNSNDGWDRNENVFIEFTTDSAGFAKIKNVTRAAPDNPNYLNTNIGYFTTTEDENKMELFFDFPFDRYYMEESKAQPAEDVYREASRDTAQITYALVNIKNGGAVLKDVVIDGKSIKDLVEENEGNKN